MRGLIVLVVLFMLATSSQAQQTIKLWEQGEIPYHKPSGLLEEEKLMWGTVCVFNVTQPELIIYKAKGENSGKAVVIFPGGGYTMEAINHEGHDVAKVLSENGITAAVLKYRLPLKEASNSPELLPITDAQRAVELMRQISGKHGFDKNRVGVMGFSAGAHLAAYSCSKKIIHQIFHCLYMAAPG